MARKEFVDLQVNGYMGIDFSEPTLTKEEFLRTSEKIFESGTCIYLPTIITNSRELYRRTLTLIYECVQKEGLQDKIPGVHLEGPFISPEPGAVGAHNPACVAKPDCNYFQEMLEFAPDFIRILTVAAEAPDVEELIKYAVSRKVTVSLGHHLAGTEDIEKAANAGATLLTHLGNGLPNMIHRHKNPIWAGLGCDKLSAMIITDGHHLPAEVIKTIVRTKGVDKVIVTSDAASVAGLPPGRYQSLGNNAILEENGLFHNPEKGCLVGSSASVSICMKYIASLGILTDEELDKVGYYNPLKAIGLL